jgi:hypothetical protein
LSVGQEVTYGVDFGAHGKSRRRSKVFSVPQTPAEVPQGSIPRVARLMALAIRFDGLLRAGELRDYAELARLGRVTRARMTQIMKLLDLAPDIQEKILFLPHPKGITERRLRPVVSRIDWSEQRSMFQKILDLSQRPAEWSRPESQDAKPRSKARSDDLEPVLPLID